MSYTALIFDSNVIDKTAICFKIRSDQVTNVYGNINK